MCHREESVAMRNKTFKFTVHQFDIMGVPQT